MLNMKEENIYLLTTLMSISMAKKLSVIPNSAESWPFQKILVNNKKYA